MYATFGKDLDILAVIGQRPQIDRATRDQLAASATRVLNETRQLLGRFGVADTELTLAVLWSTITGLADHFTSTRHELLHNTWDETIRFAARTLGCGLAATISTGGSHG
ncbi:MAG: hypothetical protein JO191_03040 [Mycobacteriaceae bacterium]|nr:hypothetical protein [Mycobacteriaceae bacterium]